MTRKLPSPRVVAELLQSAAVAKSEVVACFSSDRPLRERGALELIDPDRQRPFLDRSIRLAQPLVSFLLGAPVHEPADGRLRPVELPVHGVGRPEAVDRVRRVLEQPSRLPVLVAGPDAPAVLPRRSGARCSYSTPATSASGRWPRRRPSSAHSRAGRSSTAASRSSGKTMAAQVLANDLGLELFRVDLATVVSKYIGETEKNLDTAFQRRLDFSIDFPFPQADDRRRIWRLVLPAEAPVADGPPRAGGGARARSSAPAGRSFHAVAKARPGRDRGALAAAAAGASDGRGFVLLGAFTAVTAALAPRSFRAYQRTL